MLSGKDDSRREPSHMYIFAHFYRIFSPAAHLYRPRVSYVDDCRGDLTIPDASMQILASRKFPRRVSRDRQSSIFCDTCGTCNADPRIIYLVHRVFHAFDYTGGLSFTRIASTFVNETASEGKSR